MDTTQYLDVFIDESTEHLDTLYEQLVELENNPNSKEVIEEIFRAAHTIKGMSATMGYDDLANLTHHIENTFDDIRNEKVSVNAQLVDHLFFAVDELNNIVEDIASGGTGEKDIEGVINILNQMNYFEPEEIEEFEEFLLTLDRSNIKTYELDLTNYQSPFDGTHLTLDESFKS